MKRFWLGRIVGSPTLLPDASMIGSMRAILLRGRCVRRCARFGQARVEGIVPEATGRPSIIPRTAEASTIYGYLNRVQSSRRLEREAGRNLE